MSPVRAASLLATAVVLAGLAGTRSVAPPTDGAVASACPPGFVDADAGWARERRAEVNGLRAAGGDDAPRGGCRARSAPEGAAELLTVQNESGRRARGGQPAVRRGAYAAAVRERAAMAAATEGAWEAVGTTPLVADDPRFGEVNGEGLADLNGRVADFAYDATGDRLFAAVGEGGVWQSDDRGAHWRSIGDTLPTQAVGGIAYNNGTLVVVTGDNVFGGGGTFAGLGAFRSADGGATWQHATGVPSGVIAFKVAAGAPGVFYAATGAGLFRSTDGGATFVNVGLPVGTCAGKPPEAGCALANMVTDVVVQGADNAATDGTPGAVLAAVGWRAGAKTSIYGYAESPGNGVYSSPTGAPGSFAKAGAFAQTPNPGRIELGAATGPMQDRRYVYATVADAAKFNGEPPLDAGLNQKVPFPTNFGGVYVSADFGQTWTLMESAEQLVADATSGSALNGTACTAAQYCPGIQSWYNQWIAPDPTRATASGVPTRLAFGLEEVWAASGTPQNGPQKFEVVGPYFSGSTCLFLNLRQECPTTHSNPTRYDTTTHPDQHSAIWLPNGTGVQLVEGNDGGAFRQDLGAGQELSPDAWGRGANLGFHTLLPYDAQVAKDGTIWAGLQDNGELRIDPDGKQFMTYGGDGTISAVDPDNSQIAYESTPQNAIAKTTDGGQTWSDVAPPEDTYQFVNPFVMDPVDAAHLLTAGTQVHETIDGAGTWKTVFDLGTRTRPGDAAAAAGAGDPDNVVSALDARGVGTALPGGGKATPGFTFTGTALPGGGSDAPGTYADRPFTIAADEANRSATITVTWDDGSLDWDLAVLRDGAEIASSASGPPSNREQVVLARPTAGTYVIRVRNFAATGSFNGTAEFAPATAGDTVAGGSAAYVAYCGYCDALNTKPFANGIATNVKADGAIGRPGAADGWHIATASGLPRRYVTAVQMDPTDARTVYATIAGYSRRWLRPGVLGPDEGADLGTAHVCKSSDAGETFYDVTGNLPDVPADFALVRNGQLIVATDLGVFISPDTSGSSYVPLGSGLPTAPVLSLELKPKATAAEPDTLIVATQGRGVYRYVFPDRLSLPAAAPPAAKLCGAARQPAPGAPAPGGTPGPPAGTPGGSPAPGAGPSACVASRALTTATAKGAGRGLRIGFSRAVARPVDVDVFRVSQGRRVLTERLVARFRNKTRGFIWNGRGRKVGDGYYFVRFRLREPSGLTDVRRLVLVRSHGRWRARPTYYGRLGCSTVRSFKLLRPVFGGAGQRSLGISVVLTRPATVAVTVKRGSRVVKRFAAKSVEGGRTYRLTLRSPGLRRGDYRVTLEIRRGTERIVDTLTSRRL